MYSSSPGGHRGYFQVLVTMTHTPAMHIHEQVRFVWTLSFQLLWVNAKVCDCWIACWECVSFLNNPPHCPPEAAPSTPRPRPPVRARYCHVVQRPCHQRSGVCRADRCTVLPRWFPFFLKTLIYAFQFFFPLRMLFKNRHERKNMCTKNAHHSIIIKNWKQSKHSAIGEIKSSSGYKNGMPES